MSPRFYYTDDDAVIALFSLFLLRKQLLLHIMIIVLGESKCSYRREEDNQCPDQYRVKSISAKL